MKLPIVNVFCNIVGTSVMKGISAEVSGKQVHVLHGHFKGAEMQ